MKNLFIYLIILISTVYISFSEYGTIDTVIYYSKGIIDNTINTEGYFPQNIFGIPSRTATKTSPASSPEEIEPIGLGGEIIIGFKNKILKNGQGPDFTIFENAFINPVTNTVFAEPGIVSVSQDGITFYQFPFDTLTLKGFAGINYTNGKKDPFNPKISGGDSFDLEDLGLDYIRYIKIKDTTEFIKSLPEDHKYWNPEFILTGFDLDAIVGLYLEDDDMSAEVNEINENNISITNNNRELLILSNNLDYFQLKIYDILGNMIFSNFSNIVKFNFENNPKGFYFIDIYYNNKHIFKKIINE